MIQIIQRHEGHKSVISTLEKGHAQISYNSDGHLVVRVIHDKERDTLIVFDEKASQEVLKFIDHLTDRCRMMF